MNRQKSPLPSTSSTKPSTSTTAATPATAATAAITATATSTNFHHRRLAAFDFDNTIVAQNTDTVIRDLLPQSRIANQALSQLVESVGWTAYMAEIFRLIHDQRITPTRICDTIRCIPEVPGFVRLLKRLRNMYDFDVIIISDSNSVFISEWLKAHGLAETVLQVFTNPAEFTDVGQLKVRPYHQQQTECTLSAPNLCKGRVLEHFVVEQDLRYNIRYDRVVYVGDGNNDICPVLRLRDVDIACAREGFAMEKNLAKNPNKLPVNAELILWKNGFDLMQLLETAMDLKYDLRQKELSSSPEYEGDSEMEPAAGLVRLAPVGQEQESSPTEDPQSFASEEPVSDQLQLDHPPQPSPNPVANEPRDGAEGAEGVGDIDSGTSATANAITSINTTTTAADAAAPGPAPVADTNTN